MPAQDHGAIDINSEASERAVDELPDLIPVVLVPAEGIGQGVNDDQLRAQLAGRGDQLAIEFGYLAYTGALERHQQVLGPDAAQPRHVIQIGILDAHGAVYRVLAAMQLILRILAEYAEHSTPLDVEPKPGAPVAAAVISI